MPVVLMDSTITTDIALFPALNEEYNTDLWIPAEGSLVTTLLFLKNRPEVELVRGGTAKGCHPMYVARARLGSGLFLGSAGFHLTGAQLLVNGMEEEVHRFEVLAGTPGQYEWKNVQGLLDLSQLGGLSPVTAGFRLEDGEEVHLYVAQANGQDGNGEAVCGTVSLGQDGLFSNEGSPWRADVYCVLVHSDSNALSAKVSLGRFKSTNDWKKVRPAAKYSTAINFDSPLPSVPRIAVGISAIDMDKCSPQRIRTAPECITRSHFICSSETWSDTWLYNASVDWLSIVDEPSWQIGSFESEKELRGSTEYSVVFPRPFASGPPMVFACFNSYDLSGTWNCRVYATNVDHQGFALAIVNNNEEGNSQSRIYSASVTWIAIPGDEVLRRKNAWIGNFRTGPVEGEDTDTQGHVDFGFAFRRVPRVFVGLSQFNMANNRNFRIEISTLNVSESGMDWRIRGWGDSRLRNAGANFLAVDAAY